MLHGSSSTWFQTSRYCRAKVEFNSINLVRHGSSTTFETGLSQPIFSQWSQGSGCFFLAQSDHLYTCQLFLRYKHEIFILGVLGFLISEDSRRSPKSSEEVRSLRTMSKVFQRRPKSTKAKLSRKRLSTKSEIERKVLSFTHFAHGFCSLHGSELTYFWKLCQASRQQLTFFNQA